MRRANRRLTATLAGAWAGIGAIMAPATPALAQDAALGLGIELNRTEPVEAGCRIYLLVQNRGDAAYDTFTLELVSFGREGVIGQRLAVELAPIRAHKTLVKLFDLPGGCDQVSRLLLNDVSACTVGGQPVPDCLDRLELSTRAGIDLFK